VASYKGEFMGELIVTNNEQETFELGKELVSLCHCEGRKSQSNPATFLFYGDLGSGKTTLIRGMCVALGISENQIHSPTFAIVNEYESAIGPIYHFDAYRLTPKQWFSGGFDEYLDNGICLIEWAENVPKIEGALKVRIEGSGEESRCIRLS
jgi:tRNA threonylcarbamoyladenosine biosynthesis protein TsaE